jgi:hypothetical protein
MATLVSVSLGLGVAAACGFRIFVPFLVMNLAARAGYLTLGGDFEWIGGTPALITFAVAAALEVGAYYLPGIDNLLDVVATPAAVVAGIVASASVVTGMDPYLKWTLAAIAGGSIAGAVQLSTVGFRQASLLGTGGLANPVVSTAEVAGSLLTTIVAMLLPLITAVVIILGLITARRFRRSRVARRRQELAL